MPTDDEKDLWAFKVFGIRLNGPATASRAEGAEKRTGAPGGVAYRKMLLTWRSAQAKVENDMASIGKAILARDDVRQDPRFEQVKQMVAGLPRLIPTFGEKLGDALDAAMNATNVQDAKQLAKDAVAVIGEYREQLSQAAPLIALDDLVSKEMGQNAALHQSLQQALSTLQEELTKAL